MGDFTKHSKETPFQPLEYFYNLFSGFTGYFEPEKEEATPVESQTHPELSTFDSISESVSEYVAEFDVFCAWTQSQIDTLETKAKDLVDQASLWVNPETLIDYVAKTLLPESEATPDVKASFETSLEGITLDEIIKVSEITSDEEFAVRRESHENVDSIRESDFSSLVGSVLSESVSENSDFVVVPKTIPQPLEVTASNLDASDSLNAYIPFPAIQGPILGLQSAFLFASTDFTEANPELACIDATLDNLCQTVLIEEARHSYVLVEATAEKKVWFPVAPKTQGLVKEDRLEVRIPSEIRAASQPLSLAHEPVSFFVRLNPLLKSPTLNQIFLNVPYKFKGLSYVSFEPENTENKITLTHPRVSKNKTIELEKLKTTFNRDPNESKSTIELPQSSAFWNAFVSNREGPNVATINYGARFYQKALRRESVESDERDESDLMIDFNHQEHRVQASHEQGNPTDHSSDGETNFFYEEVVS